MRQVYLHEDERVVRAHQHAGPIGDNASGPRCDQVEYSELFPIERIALKQTVFEWCLRNARRCIDHEHMENALQWDQLAARVAASECHLLASPDLEAHLLELGAGLPIPEASSSSLGVGPRRRWLHVLTEAYPYGGHTAMMTRWIQLDPEHNRHSVVLLAQRGSVPETVAEAVRSTGGDLVQMDTNESLLMRAARLRELAWKTADAVVLHVHSWDVMATVAFAVSGGPPVMLVNHASHIFWVGCSVADLVLNCRGSALEQQWTVQYRGIDIDRSICLPIPIHEPTWGDSDGGVPSDVRGAARLQLGLPAQAMILLTIGSGYKYTALPGIDFYDAVRTILEARPDIYLVAVGPKEDQRWQQLREATGGRVFAAGIQRDVALYHAAADIYLEGFPFGSTTALLEAGRCGIPSVRAPKVCPPPFASDGIALCGFDQPRDVAEYVKQVMRLVEDEPERRRKGRVLANAIKAEHCGAGWAGHLRSLVKKLTGDHRVHRVASPIPTPRALATFWSAFTSVFLGDDPVKTAFSSASALGLEPKADGALLKGIRDASRIRVPNAPPNVLILLAGPMLKLLPSKVSCCLYESASSFVQRCIAYALRRARGLVRRSLVKSAGVT